MRRTRFDHADCPIARTADLLGDWWTPLVLRELFVGNNRFGGLHERLEISRAVLTQRLKRLESEGVVARDQYQDSPPRFEYCLTPKGFALWEVIAAMWRFGDDWLFEGGAEVQLVDTRTGREIRPAVVDAATGAPLDLPSTRLRLRRSR